MKIVHSIFIAFICAVIVLLLENLFGYQSESAWKDNDQRTIYVAMMKEDSNHLKCLVPVELNRSKEYYIGCDAPNVIQGKALDKFTQ